MSFTILVADPAPTIRQALRGLLTGQADLLVVGEAADGPNTLRLAHEWLPGW